MPLSETTATIAELRSLIRTVSEQKKHGSVDDETAFKVRKTLVKLRRSHAKLRESEKEEQKQMMKVAQSLQDARNSFANAEFIESQCQFLVEKFNSAQCPDLDKIASSLPSVEEYTKIHYNDPGFVSQEADSHQFTLNLLGSELAERERLSSEILDLKKTEENVRGEIASRQKFLSSLATRLEDLSSSLDGVKKLFNLTQPPVCEPKLFGIDTLVDSPKLFLLASKFHSVAAIDERVCVSIIEGPSVNVAFGVSEPLPPDANPTVQFNVDEDLVCVWTTPLAASYTEWIKSFSGAVPAKEMKNVEAICDEIRKVYARTVWAKYETSVLLTPGCHAALGSLVQVPGDAQLSNLKQSTAPDTYTGTVKIKSRQVVFTVNVANKLVRFTASPNLCSSAPEIGQSVDLTLAQAEIDVAEWWKTDNAPCVLASVIAKIMNTV